MDAKQLRTVGEIARELNTPPHRVAYAIDTYRIEPTQRAGILRLFDSDKIAVIRSALRRTAGRARVTT